MNNLLEIVVDDVSFLSDDIVDTLRKSFDTLLGLSVKHLRPVSTPIQSPVATESQPGELTEALELPTEIDLSGSEPAPVANAADIPDLLELPEVIDLSGREPPADAETAGTSGIPEPRQGDDTVSGQQGADPQVLEIFLEEAQEVHQILSEQVPKWAAHLDDDKTLSEIRRGFHTLKGSGRLAGVTVLAELGWTVENLLNQVLNGKLVASTALADFVDRALDQVQPLVAAYSSGEPVHFDLTPWQAEAAALERGEPPPEPGAGAAVSAATEDTTAGA